MKFLKRKRKRNLASSFIIKVQKKRKCRPRHECDGRPDCEVLIKFLKIKRIFSSFIGAPVKAYFYLIVVTKEKSEKSV